MTTKFDYLMDAYEQDQKNGYSSFLSSRMLMEFPADVYLIIVNHFSRTPLNPRAITLDHIKSDKNILLAKYPIVAEWINKLLNSEVELTC